MSAGGCTMPARWPCGCRAWSSSHSEVSNLQGLMQAISKTAERVGWQAVIPIGGFLIALSNLGASGAYLAAVARLPFVAGLDRFLPAAFGRLHSRWKTPWVALLL